MLQNSQTEVLVKQAKILKEIAKKGNAVIVGREANSILKDFNPMNIFVYASMDAKVKRCIKKADSEEKLTEKEMIKKIKEIDKGRKNFNSLISNVEWGKKENYTLCINTTDVEIKTLVTPLAEYAKNWFGGTQNGN